jgi:hypothetical protein
MAKTHRPRHHHVSTTGRNRPPILAIPGNHDDDPFLQSATHQPLEPSLFGWTRNFCPEVGDITAEAGDSARHATKQPNPFWTLEAPMANFIGLYTNVPEGGGEVKDDQRAWLVDELKHAKRDTLKVLFLCLHHPVFTAAAW